VPPDEEEAKIGKKPEHADVSELGGNEAANRMHSFRKGKKEERGIVLTTPGRCPTEGRWHIEHQIERLFG